MVADRRNGAGTWAPFLATLGPIGKCPVAPGTAGSLVGFVTYFVVALAWEPSDIVFLLFCAGLPLLAVPLCGAAEKSMGRKDPPEVVLDEFAVVPLCFVGTVSPTQMAFMSNSEISAWFLAGFALFRFFDVVKPLGIKASQGLPNGWGVVVDDVLAALCVCGCLNAGWRWLGLGE